MHVTMAMGSIIVIHNNEQLIAEAFTIRSCDIGTCHKLLLSDEVGRSSLLFSVDAQATNRDTSAPCL